MLEVSAGEHTMDRAGLCSQRLSAASFPTYSTRAQWDACTLSCTLSLLKGRKKTQQTGTRRCRNQPDSSSSPNTERGPPDNRKFVSPKTLQVGKVNWRPHQSPHLTSGRPLTQVKSPNKDGIGLLHIARGDLQLTTASS